MIVHMDFYNLLIDFHSLCSVSPFVQKDLLEN